MPFFVLFVGYHVLVQAPACAASDGYVPAADLRGGAFLTPNVKFYSGKSC